MSAKKSAGFVEIFENLVHVGLWAGGLLAVILHPFEEGLGGSEFEADKAGDFLAGAIKENQCGKSFDLIFLGESFVGGFEFGGLFFGPGEVELYQDEVLFREIFKCGLLEHIFGELHAGWAPVGACELEEDGLFARGGLGESGGIIRAPNIGGVEADCGKKEAE